MNPTPAIRDFVFTHDGAACVLACIRDSVEVAAFDVEVERNGDWYYRIAASCGELRWHTGWIKLAYLGGSAVSSPTDALSKSISLAVYFATHDFDPKCRRGATSRDRDARWAEAYHGAPPEAFAIACANALSPWLVWQLPDAAANTAPQFCKSLPPRPKPKGAAFKPPYSVLKNVQEQIRLAVETDKIAAGG
jgi:hypothetical protein